VKSKLLILAALILVFGVVSAADAGGCWPKFWTIDAITYSTSVYASIPTGCYWGGYYYPYGYNWGNYYWQYNYGCYWRSYLAQPHLNNWGLTWQGGYRYWGFTDWLTYRYTATRTIYWWSRHWDPDCSGRLLDMLTWGDDGNGNLLPLTSIPSLDVTEHTFSANSGMGPSASGSFSSVTWVANNALAFRAYLGGLYDPASVDDIMSDPMVVNVLAGGSGYVGFTGAAFTVDCVPEPASLTVLAFGCLALIRRRKR